jgi:SAM-dependent methyltransferase
MTAPIPTTLLDLLACPYCHNDLAQVGESLSCGSCRRTFPVVDGIPDLMPYDAVGPEFRKSIDAWNQEWKRKGLPAPGQVDADEGYLASLRHIVKHAPGPNDWGVFLEAGCGNGQIAYLVAKAGKAKRVVGLDCCVEACRQAKQLFARDGVQGFFVVGDLRHLPFRTDSLGYIFGWGSLEHFPDTAPAVQETYRTLRPGGRVTHTVPVISLATLSYYQLWGNIPNLPGLRPVAEWVHMKLLRGRHMRYGFELSFWPGTLRRLFRRVGFKNVRTGRPELFMKFEKRFWGGIKQTARWLAQFRWFWPMVFVDGDK